MNYCECYVGQVENWSKWKLMIRNLHPERDCARLCANLSVDVCVCGMRTYITCADHVSHWFQGKHNSMDHISF